VDVNAKNNEGKIALIYAACYNHYEIVRLLICMGTNVHVTDKIQVQQSHIEGRNSALMYAVIYGYTDIVRLLIEEGADVNTVNVNEETPLLKATECSHFGIAKLLNR